MDCISVRCVADVVDGEAGRWRRFDRRLLHDSPEVCLSEVDVGLPSRDRVWLPVVELPRSAAVVLLDDQERVLLVRRYRFVRERWGWELPGGQVDEDEVPVETVVRQLEDMTGYRAGRLEQLIVYQPAAEIVDGERVVFLGREPDRVGEPVGLEVGERAEWMALVSVPGLIAGGQVWDGTSIVGLLAVLAREG
jgi:8-oxo-dGDP phosphatase